MSGHALRWHGLQLRHGERVVAMLVPEKDYPKLYRIHLPDGRLTDMVNLTRAKDAAAALALAVVNEREAT
jgi:hypothetical protein